QKAGIIFLVGLDAPVDFGARLSGKMGQDWRIGMMDMQTAEEAGLPSRNFYVASVQKKLFSRSNIAAIFVNKQPLHLSGDARTIDYNRLAGLEYNLATSDNFLNAKFFGQKSFTPQSNSAEEYSEGVSLTYSRKSYLLEMNQLYVGRDFNAETGYVPRTNYLRTDPKVTLKFYPKSGSIENQGIYLEADDYYHPEKMRLTDRNITLDGYINFKSRVHIEAKGSAKFVELGQDFDPSHEGNHHLLKGSSYRWKEFTLLFNSDNRRPFKYDLQAGAGGYFNGSGYYLSGDFIWKFQPFGYLSLLYNFTHLNLPQPWTNQNYWLLGPKVDVTFTNNLFFTTYVQYNKQTDNLNINARFQWRYKPVSDLFLVYTDNYFPDNFHAKNRAVVLKLTYWFN
ncbi:MAG: hypothetical protein LWW85_12170, partial [Marinilabiliales bacterium]|nr:hypothetical protein [Marinilabiliales bacterium]